MELVRNECLSNLGAAHDIKDILRNYVDINHILIDNCKLDRAEAQVNIVVKVKFRKKKIT